MLTYVQDLENQGNYDEIHLADLVEGRLAAQSILARADEALGKEYRNEAVSELQSRVEDWKGHRIDHFGELLLFGSYTVLKGEGAKEVEREVRALSTDLISSSSEVVRSARKPAFFHMTVVQYCQFKRSLSRNV